MTKTRPSHADIRAAQRYGFTRRNVSEIASLVSRSKYIIQKRWRNQKRVVVEYRGSYVYLVITNNNKIVTFLPGDKWKDYEELQFNGG